MKGYRSLGMICLGLGFLFGWGQIDRAVGRDVQPGDQIKLDRPGSQSITLQIKRTGEYQIETLGESNTYCTLRDRTKGFIASDNDSGVARNCRILIRLSTGQYQLHIRKGRRPVTVRVEAFKNAGQPYPLRLGVPIQDELVAKQVRSFRLKVQRRRWLDLRAWGVTVHHCHLTDAKGWPVKIKSSHRTHRMTKRGRWRSCWLRGLVEPGTYSFQVVGQRSLPAPKSNSVTQGRLLVMVGDRPLRPFRWNRVRLKYTTSRSFWFTIPKKWGHPKTGKVKLLLQTTTTTIKVPYWSVRLSQQDWLNTYDRRRSWCYRNKKHPKSRRCDSVLYVQAGKRYKVTIRGRLNQRLWLRYVVVFPQDHVPLNRRIRVLEQPGQWTELGFAITKPGAYWIEAWPQTQSCQLQRELRPNVWRTVTVKSMALPKRQKKRSSAPAWHDVRSKRWRTRLGAGGILQWLALTTESTVVIETFGRLDTKCSLKTASGKHVAYNDDQHKKNRNCRIERRLQPGVYQISIRPYSRKVRGSITLQVKYKGDRRKTAIPVTGGCSFASNLQPGVYRLRMGSSGRLRVKEVGVFALPMANRNLIRISQLRRSPQETVISGMKIPIQLKRGYRWIAISGAQKCSLRRKGKLVKRGWRKGRICQIRGKLMGGVYTLSFQQYLRKTQRITVRIGASSNLHRASYRSLPLVGSKDRHAQVIPLQNPAQNPGQTNWVTHFALSKRQQTKLLWKVPRSGLYRIQTQGLMKVQCFIQNARSHLYHSKQPILHRRNCHWLGYLQAGSYHVNIQAVGESQGRVSVLLDAINSTTYKLPLQQNIYNILYPKRGAVYQWKLRNKGVYHLQAHSIDGNIKCRLERADGWPLFSGKNCNYSLSLHPGSYRLYLYPNQHKSRYRLSLNESKGKKWYRRAIVRLRRSTRSRIYRRRVRFRRSTRSRIYRRRARFRRSTRSRVRLRQASLRRVYRSAQPRNVRSKPITLPLQRTVQLRYAAPQPSDTVSVVIPTTMTVQVKLSKALLGRLFRKDTFVTKWSGGKPNTTTLKAGTYRLVLQGKGVSLRSSTHYNITIQVQRAEPGFRLRQRVPSQLQVRLKQAGHIEIATEGDQDVWCKISDQRGQLIASNDNASPSRWDCKLLSWLPAGIYNIALDGTRGRTWLQVKRQRPPRQNRTGTTTLKYAVKQEGIYQLSFPGQSKDLKSLRCDVTHASAFRKKIPCDEMQILAKGTYLWRIWSPTQQKRKVTLRHVSMSVGRPYTLQLRNQTTLALPLHVMKAGLYRVRGTHPIGFTWFAKAGKRAGFWKQITPQHSDYLTYLGRGKQQVFLQAPRGQRAIQGTLRVTRIFSGPKATAEILPGSSEGKIVSGKPVRFKLKGSHAYQITITLDGKGSAIFIQGEQDVLQQCDGSGDEVRTCRWYASSTKGLQLWMVSPHTMRYRIVLRQAPLRKLSVVLKPGQQWRVPSIPDASGQLMLHLQGKGRAKFEVMGGKTQCTLLGPNRMKRGCHSTVNLQTGHHQLVIRYEQAPKRILLYAPGQRSSTLWGSHPSETKATKLPAHQWLDLGVSHTKMAGYTMRIKQAQVVRLHVRGNGRTVCAIGQKKRAGLWVDASQTGCLLEKPLLAGHYWIGIRSESGATLRGQVYLSHDTAISLREGRQGPYLLGSGESRWFVFKTSAKRRVGLGAIGRHDDLQCLLKNNLGQTLLKGCQRYQTLSKGTYWYRIGLPKRAKATTVQIVLRGQVPPPTKVPTSYRKRMIKE